MPCGWACDSQEKRFVLISLTILFFSWSCCVFCQDNYIPVPEIHRIWPSLRIPNVIISQPTAEDAEELARNTTAIAEEESSSLSSRKTVVFPSPICVSLPIAPCIILQVFWRNSSSSVLGVRVPTNRIPSWPRPRERQLSNSQFYKMFAG